MRCSGCDKPNDREGQRYCRRCHAAYMRDWRRQRTAELAALRRVTRETRLLRGKAAA